MDHERFPKLRNVDITVVIPEKDELGSLVPSPIEDELQCKDRVQGHVAVGVDKVFLDHVAMLFLLIDQLLRN